MGISLCIVSGCNVACGSRCELEESRTWANKIIEMAISIILKGWQSFS